VSRIARRSLVITEELIRRYSRRGNYHSEASTASELGLPGLVAQGTQVTGPAYGLLLDAWGEDFLARGTLDVKFVGVTLAGDTVTATVTFDAESGATAAREPSARHDGGPHADATTTTATIEVRNDTRAATAVAGAARRR
jgi:acyl dehydratase